MTQNNLIKAICAVALISGSLNAMALESDRQQPIQIEADQGSLDQKNQVTVFTGNVIAKQGTLNMRANNVRVSQDQSGNQTIDAQGNPAYFRQMLDNNKGIAEGWGNRMEYQSQTNVVKLIGNAKIQRGGDMAQGEAISYNTKTEVYTVLGGNATGNKNGRRVTVIIQPNTANKK
ncbi:lipopolysaccharide transport periplasmic protein LptA [Kingella negevensis]|uniref:lipopolysaccharide transport periplasmic protein LptA n=1 Tax=Kingella negevensis TaxID=1522312 RepID=UPI00050A30F5|nr:lipopolysaccharide transport periplasmic protein LptA [Kingella negevensis]MDK4688093.1 lipopolysaccharide transport periplasmic protein LptA [Kingella negevensis]WII90924.1 lipopolysaccharide transport periplasmic protein LptA [Kingella negevensis]